MVGSTATAIDDPSLSARWKLGHFSLTSGSLVMRRESSRGIELPAGANRLVTPITEGKVEFWEKVQLPSLLRQPHFPHQFGEAWVGTYRIEYEVSFQTVH